MIVDGEEKSEERRAKGEGGKRKREGRTRLRNKQSTERRSNQAITAGIWESYILGCQGAPMTGDDSKDICVHETGRNHGNSQMLSRNNRRFRTFGVDFERSVRGESPALFHEAWLWRFAKRQNRKPQGERGRGGEGRM